MQTMKKTKTMALMGVLIAIQLVLTFTPLGFIPLGFTNATTLHIPVIIGAIFLGPVAGGVLGGVFGILSIITNTIRPNVTSFVFSPFIGIGAGSGSWLSLIVAIVPRVLIGITAYYAFKGLQKIDKNKNIAYIGAGVVGSLTNTILVMTGIYLFFGDAYAAAKGVDVQALFGVIMGIIGINGVPEAIVAGILVLAIGKVLGQIFFRNRR